MDFMEALATEIARRNNVNDNGFLNRNNNDNDIDRAKRVDYIADKLVSHFSSPESRGFYCKIAWKLPENKIWLNLEKSASGKNPAGLFNWLCSKDLT